MVSCRVNNSPTICSEAWPPKLTNMFFGAIHPCAIIFIQHIKTKINAEYNLYCEVSASELSSSWQGKARYKRYKDIKGCLKHFKKSMPESSTSVVSVWSLLVLLFFMGIIFSVHVAQLFWSKIFHIVWLAVHLKGFYVPLLVLTFFKFGLLKRFVHCFRAVVAECSLYDSLPLLCQHTQSLPKNKIRGYFSKRHCFRLPIVFWSCNIFDSWDIFK